MTDEERSNLIFLREQPKAADLAMIFADATEAGVTVHGGTLDCDVSPASRRLFFGV